MSLHVWKLDSRAPGNTRRTRQALLLAAFCAVSAVTGFAAAPTNASVSGSYEFQFSTVREVYWSKVVTCTYPKASFNVTAGGQSETTELTYGTMTFDGKSKVTVSYTDLHKFDQASTNATMKITCPSSPTGAPTINNGHVVVDSPSTVSTSGTYTVEANGTGVINVGDGGLDFSIAGASATGLNSTLILRSPATDGSASTGIAVHK